LASLLGLQDEEMVEFAILLGNDYVQDSNIPKKDRNANFKDPIAIVRYLQDQNQGFRVRANSNEQALSYVRALYDLRDLNAFPLEEASRLSGESSKDDDTIDILQVSLPQVLRTEVANITIEDSTVVHAIIRCVATYLEQIEDDGNAPLEPEHLTAYLEMVSSPENSANLVLNKRPRWHDIRAAFAIELCISRILKVSTDSLLVRIVQPSQLFNHYHFHSTLASLRPDDSDEIPEALEEAESVVVERKRLPIDDHEETILRDIQHNRVTIIHGETGCGKSSRVPIMILEAPPPEPTLSAVKLFIAQPRRIAAKGLVERIRSCEPQHRDRFALRMGHGWKEYETKKVRCLLCTKYMENLVSIT
jgi:hypothetical protein